MRRRIFIIISWGLLTIAATALSSSSYKIPARLIDSGGAASTSTSYKLLGKTRPTGIVNPTSTNFILGEGFLKSAYIPPSALAPIVTGISPESGTNAGTIEIKAITGANFAAGAIVKLTKSGQDNIYGTSIIVVSAGKITCVFDLAGAATGLWDVTVINQDGRSGTLPAAFRIGYAVPTIDNISPRKGFNDAPVEIDNLSGNYFRSGAVVKLKKTGETDITATNVAVESAKKITCRFDITGKMVGDWDVLVANDDGAEATLAGGFKIEEKEVRLITPPAPLPVFNPDAGTSAAIKYTLSRDVDIIIYMFNIRGERVWEKTIAAGGQGAKAGSNRVEWDGYFSEFKSFAGSGVYIYWVMAKEGGETKLLGKGKIVVNR